MKGFSVLEIVVVIGIFLLITTIPTTFYLSWKNSTELNNSFNSLVHQLGRAQVLAQANSGDLPWGVKMQTGKITVFQGTNHAGRVLAKDEDIIIPSTITFPLITEIVFNKYSGMPVSFGLISISKGSDTKQITVNSKGILEY
jgi:Tfp pilus assembly protein FimT